LHKNSSRLFSIDKTELILKEEEAATFLCINYSIANVTRLKMSVFFTTWGEDIDFSAIPGSLSQKSIEQSG
jgi:hypothetical protein